MNSRKCLHIVFLPIQPLPKYNATVRHLSSVCRNRRCENRMASDDRSTSKHVKTNVIQFEWHERVCKTIEKKTEINRIMAENQSGYKV